MNLRKLLSSQLSPRMRVRAIELERNGRERLAPVSRLLGVHRASLRKALRRPEEVAIEITSACDADCIMCPRRSMTRQQGQMDIALFRKIVDEAVEMGVPRLALNGYGEISTAKNYRDYLSYIRAKSGDVTISINTNGMRMSENMALDYIDFRVNVVNVTIDGAQAQTFETIRRYLKLEQVELNVRRLISLRNELNRTLPLVSLSMLVMEQNKSEVEQFRRKWEGVADKVIFAGLVNRAGSVPWVQIGAKPNWDNTPCYLLWSQLPIWSDGSAALCCDDWNGAISTGNAASSSLEDLWRGAARQELRNLHSQGDGYKISLCNACQTPYSGPEWFRDAHRE